jgi:hypothetical protein
MGGVKLLEDQRTGWALPPLTDNPVTQIGADAFGFRPYINELHEAVVAATPLPLTVGVFGPWGSGKSSFLKMWEDLLNPTTRTLWFNPWKYDRKIEVWAALIQSLLAEMRASGNEGLKEKVVRLARTATWLGLRAGLGTASQILTHGVIDKATVGEILDSLADDGSSYYREVNRFELDFTDAVGEFVGPSGRLVVFVDDLDRCTPDAALSVLEALKLFVGDARCVFVLAMDFDILSAVAERRFGDHLQISGSEYLEKIIQLPFFLPDITFDSLRASLSRHAGDLAGNDAFWELVELGFGSNPRRVKRYINVLNLAIAIARREDSADRRLDVIHQLQLAKLLIIRSEHRDLFNYLLRHPEALSELENSPALPHPGSGGTVEIERERNQVLVPFLNRESLTRLLNARPGAYLDHPSAPGAKELAQMLRTVQLTSGPPSSAHKSQL